MPENWQYQDPLTHIHLNNILSNANSTKCALKQSTVS